MEINPGDKVKVCGAIFTENDYKEALTLYRENRKSINPEKRATAMAALKTCEAYSQANGSTVKVSCVITSVRSATRIYGVRVKSLVIYIPEDYIKPIGECVQSGTI